MYWATLRKVVNALMLKMLKIKKKYVVVLFEVKT